MHACSIYLEKAPVIFLFEPFFSLNFWHYRPFRVLGWKNSWMKMWYKILRKCWDILKQLRVEIEESHELWVPFVELVAYLSMYPWHGTNNFQLIDYCITMLTQFLNLHIGANFLTRRERRRGTILFCALGLGPICVWDIDEIEQGASFHLGESDSGPIFWLEIGTKDRIHKKLFCTPVSGPIFILDIGKVDLRSSLHLGKAILGPFWGHLVLVIDEENQ